VAIVKNIKKQAKDNSFFRKVLETGKFTQVVIMSIPPGGEIGEEIHDDTDQVLCLAEGEGQVILEGEISEYGKEDLKIITMYSPPHHPPGTVHKTKAEADKAEY